MNTELLAAAALAGHGTVWLQEPDGAAPRIDEAHLVFQHVARARFRPPTRQVWRWRLQPPDVHGVAPWLASLHRRGIERIWLVVPGSASASPLPQHIAAAFAGGGSWSLLATGPRGTEAWTPTWGLADPSTADDRIWDISCTGVTVDAGVRPPAIDLDEAEADLEQALEGIRAFAAEHERGTWADFFEQALTPPDPATEQRTFDVLPPAYPTAAHRLLARASASWVFGGMGSWNDLGRFDTPEVDARYDAVSADLHRAILAAVMAAVNVPL